LGTTTGCVGAGTAKCAVFEHRSNRWVRSHRSKQFYLRGWGVCAFIAHLNG